MKSDLIKSSILVKHIGWSLKNASTSPKPADELAYPNARQTETLLQIGIEMTKNKEHLAVTATYPASLGGSASLT